MRPWIPTAPEGDDAQRAQRMLGVFDADPRAELDAIVNVAHKAFSCPIAMVNIFDGPNVRFAAQQGLDGIDSVPRERTFCEIARRGGELLVVEDATLDPRFAGLGSVTGDLHIRFYAGAPLRLRDADGTPGPIVGTVCIADTRPRRFAVPERRALTDIARVVETVIEARRSLVSAIAIAEERSARGRQLRRADRLFRQAERIASIGSWRYSLASGEVELSDQSYAIHGLPLDVPPPSLDDALNVYPAEPRARLFAAITACAEMGEAFDLELDAFGPGGTIRVRVMGELESAGDEPQAVIGVVQDITARHRLEEALRRSASIDDLTGIANRAAFGAELETRMAASRIAGTPLALLLIDLDGYKAINDAHGHLAGDEVLRRVATRLAETPCAGAFAARLGGDELALILPAPDGCGGLDAQVTQLLADLAQPVVVDGVTIAVSGTIGGAWLGPEVAGVRDMVQRADLALYTAKRHRRGTARIFGSDRVIARGVREG